VDFLIINGAGESAVALRAMAGLGESNVSKRFKVDHAHPINKTERPSDPTPKIATAIPALGLREQYRNE